MSVGHLHVMGGDGVPPEELELLMEDEPEREPLEALALLPDEGPEPLPDEAELPEETLPDPLGEIEPLGWEPLDELDDPGIRPSRKNAAGKILNYVIGEPIDVKIAKTSHV